MNGGGARVSIPPSLRRTIQNIKEIAGHHTDEDIYSMLKECAMDPNETAQKLLLQDTFHEVKRKRDKRNGNVREHSDCRWRAGALGRGGGGGHQNFSNRYLSNDVADSRNITSGKENGAEQGPDKDNTSVLPIGTGKGNKSTTFISSTVSGITNSHNETDMLLSSQGCLSQVSSDSTITSREECSAKTNLVTVPSPVGCSPGKLGTIKHVIQCGETVVEMATNKVVCDAVSPLMGKGSKEMSSSYVNREIQVKSKGSEANQLTGASEAAFSSSEMGPTGSRSSNYGNHSQQPVGSQKVVPNKEWKPKSAHTDHTQASGIAGNYDVPMMGNAVSQSVSVPASCSVELEETISKLEKKLDEVQLSVRQHVIIPDHLQVTGSERHGLSFGSFDACFNVDFANDDKCDKSATQLSGSLQENEENVEQPSSWSDIPLCCIHIASSASQEDHPDHIQSPRQMPENYSSREAGIYGTSATKEYGQAKQEPVIAPEDPKIPVVPSISMNSTFGLALQMFGNQFVPFWSSEPGACDTNLPNFVNGSSVILSTAGSTPLATQAVGAMQSSGVVSQQPVPIFRQTAGVHLSHYPISYGQYFSPFYVPPPALHPFLSSVAFPQQPHIGSMYPHPGTAAAAAPVKFSLSQYKPGTNISSSAFIGIPAGYGSYDSTPTCYTYSPVVSSGNSTSKEDLNSTQFKENNIYSSEQQQSEGSAAWIPAPGQDNSSLQTATTFYGMPPHMTLAPTQTGHGALGGIYHPASASVHPLVQQSQAAAGAVEMVGPAAGVYQQPQHAQINWTGNY
ncbi:GBF-interacting protein 1-like isoform X3 [Musa acuminata AAA Group]|uniref:GBF-interacting protein 1-like isoform X3 n=1 Tax=Musa acuminata AAA Group TaxID=214697 RepID=UPI0031D9B0DD